MRRGIGCLLQSFKIGGPIKTVLPGFSDTALFGEQSTKDRFIFARFLERSIEHLGPLKIERFRDLPGTKQVFCDTFHRSSGTNLVNYGTGLCFIGRFRAPQYIDHGLLQLWICRGRANQGAHPANLRDKAVALGITINGLAILNEDLAVAEYYRAHVIGGTGAFVMTANDYESYALAILIKLVREIAGAPIAARPCVGSCARREAGAPG